MVLRAREIMTDRVVTVREDTPISTARDRLSEGHFGALPVVDGHNRLMGIVTAADLVEPRSDAAGPVGAVMTRRVMSATPNTDVGIIAHRLRTYGEMRAMPIVDHGVLVGIVTRADLLRPQPRGGPLGRLAWRVLHRARHDLSPAGADATGHPVRSAAPRALRRRRSSAALVAADVMTAEGLVTVPSTASTERAADLLTRHRFTALPVVDGDRLCGIVSEADLVHDPLDGRRLPHPRTVAAAMTTDVVTLPRGAPLSELDRLLSGRGLRVVPIVDGHRLVGVVSRGDLLRAAASG